MNRTNSLLALACAAIVLSICKSPAPPICGGGHVVQSGHNAIAGRLHHAISRDLANRNALRAMVGHFFSERGLAV